MNDEELKQIIIEKAMEYYWNYYRKFPVTKGYHKQIEWKFDLNTLRAGQANGNFVEYNLVIARNNLSEFLVHTVPHEIAHLIDFRENDYSSHGSNWKRIMWILGVEPNRCSNYDNYDGVRTNRNRKYKCGTCGQEFLITAKKENNLSNCYCKRCKGNQFVFISSPSDEL